MSIKDKQTLISCTGFIWKSNPELCHNNLTAKERQAVIYKNLNSPALKSEMSQLHNYQFAVMT